MASLLANPVYITAQDVRDTTGNAALIALTDAQIEALITQAQYIIDNYIRCYGTPFVEWQEFIFPIDVDGVSTIPDDIMLATFYIVENLFVVWPQYKTRTVIEEKTGKRTIKFSSDWSDVIPIPGIAQQILDQYASRFIKQSLSSWYSC